MIDDNLLFSLELCALTLLVGLGLWRLYRSSLTARNDDTATPAYDMRRDGQRFNMQSSAG